MTFIVNILTLTHFDINHDSEWHAFYDCHVCLAPRRRFRLALVSLNSKVSFSDENRKGRMAIVADLVHLVIQCREHIDVISEFTRFIVDLVDLFLVCSRLAPLTRMCYVFSHHIHASLFI